MLVTSQEFCDFMVSPWEALLGGEKDDWYYEDENEALYQSLFDEALTPKNPTQTLKLEDLNASVLYQGRDKDTFKKGTTLVELFKKWRKAKSTVALLLEVPREAEEVFRKFMADQFPQVKIR